MSIAQAFVDLLAGEVDVGAVLEDGDDLREAELRDAPELGEAFQAAEGVLDRKEMSRSTSSGESSGATVLIWTWTGVVSGKASSGRRVADLTPATMSRPATSRTKKRFLRLKAMTALSMA
jgi:hypothetical protein